jgi:hypothetical protein
LALHPCLYFFIEQQKVDADATGNAKHIHQRPIALCRRRVKAHTSRTGHQLPGFPEKMDLAIR